MDKEAKKAAKLAEKEAKKAAEKEAKKATKLAEKQAEKDAVKASKLEAKKAAKLEAKKDAKKAAREAEKAEKAKIAKAIQEEEVLAQREIMQQKAKEARDDANDIKDVKTSKKKEKLAEKETARKARREEKERKIREKLAKKAKANAESSSMAMTVESEVWDEPTVDYSTEQTDANNRAPLFWAVAKNDIVLVSEILEGKKCDINRQAFVTGMSPLEKACSAGFTDVARLLIFEGGADVEIANSKTKDTTPIFAAAFNGHIEVVEMLVREAGANLNAHSSEEKTPLDIAGGRYENIKLYKGEQSAQGLQAERDRHLFARQIKRLGAKHGPDYVSKGKGSKCVIM